MNISTPDTMQINDAGSFFESATAIDLASHLRVCGDAATIRNHSITAAAVVAQPDRNVDDPFWFIDVDSRFASPSTFAGATAMVISLARITDHSDQTPVAAQVNSVVLVGASHNLYVKLAGRVRPSTADAPAWTNRVLSFDRSTPWRLGGPLLRHGTIERLHTDSNDPFAVGSEISDTLNSLEAIRIRPATCHPDDLIAVREIALLRTVQSVTA